jgi:hypothetical protein
MSQFDLPRINFFGKAIINAATANNNTLLPLVVFDPIKNKAVVPPRIYFMEGIKTLHAKAILSFPLASALLTDENGSTYIEINTINSANVFKQWITTPLGKSPFDKEYHPLYKIIRTIKNNQRLQGLIPSSWNYYGGMDFKFDNVLVSSIEVSSYKNNKICYSKEDENCPPDIARLLNATISFADYKGKNTAVMIDVIPTLALYSQVFCDSFLINKKGKILLKGKPCKASLRHLNLNRILNQEDALASSGTFFSTILLNDLEDTENDQIIEFFRKHNRKCVKIAGVFVRYNLFEVKEKLYPEQKGDGIQHNPAQSSVLGSISPWYETEMKSISMGRQMVPVHPFYKNKTLPPFVCCFDHNRKILSLDLIGAIPEIIIEDNVQQTYSTFNLGDLKIRIKTDQGSEIEIGSLSVNENHLNRQHFINAGGIFEFPYSNKGKLKKKDLINGELKIYGLLEGNPGTNPADLLLMQESEYMVASDQSGIYTNQYDSPEEGYRSYSHEKEPCRIKIYHKGIPVKRAIPMTILELRLNSLRLNSPFSESVSIFYRSKTFNNKQDLIFPTEKPGNVIYVFYPGNTYKGSKYLIPDIVSSGNFINLRILPKHDYGKYLDPEHPQYPTPVTFKLIYQEILQVYDLIFPFSSIITPFTREYFENGWEFIQPKLRPEKWDSFSYMPSSRDMSDDQWLLLCKWAADSLS